jgi:hypothetical protein
MGISLEPTLTAAASVHGRLAGRPLEDWNTAYVKVERYFTALQVRNRLLLGQLVTRVLDRAIARAPHEPETPALVLAGEEMDRLVSEWYEAVLAEPAKELLSTRGRLALLLADMPVRWQDQFLSPGPWPEEFIHSMRQTYLRAGPDFQVVRMQPRPIDLGPIAHLTNLSNFPYFRMMLAWAAFAALLTFIFEVTH